MESCDLPCPIAVKLSDELVLWSDNVILSCCNCGRVYIHSFWLCWCAEENILTILYCLARSEPQGPTIIGNAWTQQHQPASTWSLVKNNWQELCSVIIHRCHLVILLAPAGLAVGLQVLCELVLRELPCRNRHLKFWTVFQMHMEMFFSGVLCMTRRHSPTGLCSNHFTCFAMLYSSMLPGNLPSQLERGPNSLSDGFGVLLHHACSKSLMSKKGCSGQSVCWSNISDREDM